jgi:hypothetical protein
VPDSSTANQEAVKPGALAQTTPPVRSLDDMNTGAMVFELQGTVGELKESVANLARKLDTSEKRLEVAEKTASDIRDILKSLVPKIDDVVGFTKHAAPNFANKADMATLNAEIQKRPTRWQAVVALAALAAFAVALLNLGVYVAKMVVPSGASTTTITTAPSNSSVPPAKAGPTTKANQP